MQLHERSRRHACYALFARSCCPTTRCPGCASTPPTCPPPTGAPPGCAHTRITHHTQCAQNGHFRSHALMSLCLPFLDSGAWIQRLVRRWRRLLLLPLRLGRAVQLQAGGPLLPGCDQPGERVARVPHAGAVGPAALHGSRERPHGLHRLLRRGDAVFGSHLHRHGAHRFFCDALICALRVPRLRSTRAHPAPARSLTYIHALTFTP
jgi:hypothetical protein